MTPDTDTVAATPQGPPDMFEWSVWDLDGGEIATGLTDGERRAQQRVTDVMRASLVAVNGAVALVGLNDGEYELLRSVANAYRSESNEVLWDDLDV